MTTHRAGRTARSAALAAVTAALAVGLTACGGGDGSKAAGAGHAAGSAQGRSASDGNGKGSAEQADTAGDTKTEVRSATASTGTDKVESTSKGKGTTAGAVRCRGDEMLVTAVHRFAGQEGDHLLVTASNEGSKPCWVTSYPAVKLGDDVDGPALPHSKKDAPGGDKHITLRPGDKVYSAVNLFDYGSKNQTARSFAIALRGADGRSGPFYSVDVKGQKPEFRWNEADVLNWNAKKPYDF
ncbi:DUF4232 domain-containing protein [Streptomyces sp. IBSBF 3136]|uniref:DUF4232 domain-containing protein n=1 Tax=Streptomyces sp. IBSBF 3136 TaxID=2903524 RepID=UPI002FDBA56D